MKEEYKTMEELKSELGDKYDQYMYDINLELVKKLDKIKNIIENKLKENDDYKEILDIID